MSNSEYALAGVDYDKIGPFKVAMMKTARRTTSFPEKHHDVMVYADGTYQYVGIYRDYLWARPVLEGLGNKNWISE